jgi:bacterial/archaeal transporter family-2 protein
VSGGNALAVLLAAAAGLGSSVQAAIVGRFGNRIGSVEALGCSMLAAGITGTVVLLVARQSLHGITEGARQPAWLWLGGLLSAFIVLSLIVATPRIGVAASIGILIGGQLVMAAVIDRFGLFGVDRIALHWPRLLGIALLAVGAALSLRT